MPSFFACIRNPLNVATPPLPALVLVVQRRAATSRSLALPALLKAVLGWIIMCVFIVMNRHRR